MGKIAEAVNRVAKGKRLTSLVSSDEKTPAEYFEDMATDTALPERKGRCHDCAISCNFYTPIADELAKESKELQQRVLNGWFCHQTPNKMCKGAQEHLGLDKHQEKRGENK